MRGPIALLTLRQTDTLSPRAGSYDSQSPGRPTGAPGPLRIKAPNRYEIVVALAAAAHFAFIGYVVAGGLLTLRWRRTFWLYAPAGLWATTWIVAHQPCPLNKLEHWARAKAGMQALPENGFIGHYIDGVIYPASWKRAIERVTFVMVVAPWALHAWRALRRNDSAQRR